MDPRHLRYLVLAAALLAVALFATPGETRAEGDLWTPMADGQALTEGLFVHAPDHDLAVAFGGRDKHVNKSSTVSDVVMVLDTSIESAEWQDVTRRVAGLSPGKIYGTAGAYWPSRQEMVFFSGKGNGNKIVGLDLSGGADRLRWNQPRTSGSVAGRAGHTAVYVPEADTMLVFGGNTGSPTNVRLTLNDVVEISSSGTGFAIRTLTVAEGPSPRLEHSAIYDPVNRWMVVYGGSATAKTAGSAELWALNMSEPQAPRWIDLGQFVVGDTPGGRKAHTAVYDPRRQQMVIYGGRGASANELWALNLGAGIDGLAWERLADATAPNNPQGLSDHGAVWLPAHDCMIVYGGSGRSGENAGAWMYHPHDSPGHNWRPDPGPRCDAYDAGSACGARMTVRVFIDRRCDGVYNPGFDTLLTAATVTVDVPFAGRSDLLTTDSRGKAYSDNLDVPAGQPLALTVEHPSAKAVCGYEENTILVAGSRFGPNNFAALSIGMSSAE